MNNNDIVIIELDRPRELRYGYKALKHLVALTGKGLEEISELDFGADSLELIEKVIYCGLLSDAQKHGESLKLEDMENLLDMKPIQYTIEKMNEAFAIAFGASEEETEKNLKRVAQTGEKVKFYDFDAALRSAIRIGLTVCEFEELTPYQLNLMIEAYAEKQKEQLEKDITVAYLNSMWTIQWLGKRHQHPKPLKEILARIGKEKKPMTDDQMLATVKVLNAAFGGGGEMMAKSNFIVRGGADFSGIKRELQKTQKQLGTFQTNVNKGMSALGKGVKAALAYVSVRAITGFVKATTKIASDLTEVQNVVDVTFGSMAKDIEEFSKTSIKTFGLSELSAKKYTSSLGAMLKSSGIAGESVRDMAVNLAKLSADMASFYNLPNEEAFNKIMAGMTGIVRPLRELGINMNVVNLEAYALSKGIRKSWEQMTQAEQIMLRYEYLLSVTGDAQGDFARNAHTWANQTKVLSQQFEILKGTIGKGFINALMPVVKMLNSLIKHLQVAAEHFRAFTVSIFGEAEVSTQGGVVVESLEDIESGLDDVSEASKKAKGSLAGFDEINVLATKTDTDVSELMSGIGGGLVAAEQFALPEPDTSWITPLQKSLSELSSFISKKFMPTISSWGKAFGKLAEPAKNAFNNLKASVGSLWNNTLAPFGKNLVSDWIPSISNGFSETFAPIFADVMPVLIGEWAKTFSFACGQVDRVIKDVYQTAMELMKNAALDAFGGIKTAWNEHGAGILDGFRNFTDSLRGIWDNLYSNTLKPVFDKIGNMVSWLWDKHLKPLWDNVTDFIGSVGEFLFALWNNVLSPLVNRFISDFGPPIANIIGFIGDVFGTVFGLISDLVSGLLKALSGLLDFLTGVFTGNWEKAWNGIKKIFKGVWDALVGILKTPINLIIDGLNLLIRGLNSIKFDVPDWVPVIGGKGFGFKIPEIPKLAKGGIVYGRSIVEVAEYAGVRSNPEVIAPLEKLKEIFANIAGGGDIYLTNYVVLEDGTLIGPMAKKITRGSRVTGAPAVGV